jgi:hypothetical protein
MYVRSLATLAPTLQYSGRYVANVGIVPKKCTKPLLEITQRLCETYQSDLAEVEARLVFVLKEA